ncbi:hypothetical protein LEP1GSC202_1865 [Leptospira yanagawae serovar Saopaulo str. Sao Paulo = ATCC 700523]|uniref:Uncharacterized protein n=1 Tax=Leptospira yanagawae serovar Saopaulo str. Sao Paulo = ATCC 700523 TaxID=1249483 RepID=A0A5E8HF10_9LEPT|nr:hypothetical protein LEP1GSC202_1865 [Leptospira yanagawae serovar Saopaulo str. Sao Paulo = ATCC 700523]
MDLDRWFFRFVCVRRGMATHKNEKTETKNDGFFRIANFLNLIQLSL